MLGWTSPLPPHPPAPKLLEVYPDAVDAGLQFNWVRKLFHLHGVALTQNPLAFVTQAPGYHPKIEPVITSCTGMTEVLSLNVHISLNDRSRLTV